MSESGSEQGNSQGNAAWETLAACLRLGVGDFVVCGGARNALLLELLARLEERGAVKVWHHFEERAAGFFALGRCIASGAPCAVVTTSGTAVAELLPAVVEAFHQARPLVLVTADRPPSFRGSGAPQTIEQEGLFGCHAAGDPETWDGHGPLHLNVALEEEFDLSALPSLANAEVAPFRPREAPPVVAELARWLRGSHFRGLVVMVGSLEPDEREEVFHFCANLGAPVVAEAASGLREALRELALPDADRSLRAKPPARILRLGGVPSGRFWRDLEEPAFAEVEVWSVCRQKLPGLARPSRVLSGRVDRSLAALGEMEEAGDALDLLADARRKASRIDELLEAWPDGEPGLLRSISHYASLAEGVFLGNSLPIREWNGFAQWDRPVPLVAANRGANGIDGQLSTWLGWSADLASSWALVGDLTALYDLAAPYFIGQLPAAERVLVVVNNGGGRIFSRVPRLTAMHPSAARWMENPHAADLTGWCRLWGLRHLRVKTVDDLDAYEAAEGLTVLELCPDPAQSAAFWKAWDGGLG